VFSDLILGLVHGEEVVAVVGEAGGSDAAAGESS